MAVAATRVDPVTFEVLRHRLAMIVDEAAQVLKEVSGSPVASDVGDCNAALMDAEGNAIMVGPLLLGHALSCANVAKYALAHFRATPGVGPGDMFISNDPYRATPHQACVVVVAPVFHEGELAAWTGAGIHLADVGGPVPGQVTVGAQSIFEEPTPMPPMKLIEGGVLRADIQENWLIRGRTKDANALDLRAKIASNLRLAQRFREMVERYGIETVRGVLQQTIEFTAETIRDRLRQIPDGTWRAEALLDYDDRGNLALYRCKLELSKTRDHMTFDFRGTSPQAPAVINSTRSSLQIAVVHALLMLMTWDLPKCPAGLMKTYDLVSELGTFVDAQWPAGMTKATTAANVAVRQAVHSAVSQMYASSAAFADRVMAQGYGYSALVEMGGRDQRGEIFAACLLDHSMSSGSAAHSFRDGVHSGGTLGAGGSSLANVEVYEQRYPLLYLTRREQIDTAGPGRFQGGSACCTMVTPHDTERVPDVVLHRLGVHVPSYAGLHGGLPGSTNQFVIKRRSNVQELLGAGVLPTDPAEIAGEPEIPAGLYRTHLERGDVYYQITGGGGGYGDPLEREPDWIERDLRLGYVSADQAAAVYGAVVDNRVEVDRAATHTRREALRRERLARAERPDGARDEAAEWRLGGGAGDPVTDAIALVAHEGALAYACRCGAVLGRADMEYRAHLHWFDAPCTAAGPYCLNLEAEPRVVLRHYVCPGCGRLLEVDLRETD
jgi:N-methylhydantoinase B